MRSARPSRDRLATEVPTANLRRLATLFFSVLLTPLAAAGLGDLELLSRSNVPPNVMIFLDTSGSMKDLVGGTTRIEIAVDALKDLVDSTNPPDGQGGRTERARLGLTRFPAGVNESGNGVSGSPYFADCVGATLITPVESGNTDTILSQLDVAETKVLADEWTEGTCLSESLVDIARYMGGGVGFPSYPSSLAADRPSLVYSGGSMVSKTMEPFCTGSCPSPIDLECRQSFVLLMTDGFGDDDENNHYGTVDPAVSTAGSAFLTDVGNADGDQNECDPNAAAPSACTAEPTTGRDDGVDHLIRNGIGLGRSGTDWLDDVAWKLARTDFAPALTGDQNLTTFTVGFTVDDPLLSEAALNGGGEYYTANNSAALEAVFANAMEDIFEETTASFTSAVVPTSQTRFGAGFYNAYFESSKEPVWEGHLEAFRLSPGGEVQGVGLTPVLDTDGGLLVTRQHFWDAGDQLAVNSSRNLYTTLAGARADFATANAGLTMALLDVTAAGELPVYPNHPGSGVDTTAELRDAVIDYIHGKDAFDEDDDSDATELRDVVMGDIFHSTPQVVGPPSALLLHEPGYPAYRTAYATRDRVVYAGANDGVLHAFDAGQHYAGDDLSTPETEDGYWSPGLGDEVFGYVPGALLHRMKLVPRNSPRQYFFVDGSPVAADAWLGDGSGSDVTKTADEWATVMITGYRQGGSGYLALDVTSPGAGAAAPHGPYPKLLWEFTHAKLAESWSQPVITRVRMQGPVGVGDHCGVDDGDGDCVERWVAVFAGGYAPDGDPNRSEYEGDPNAATFSPAGKALFLVALDTGALLASVEYDAAGTDGPDDMLYALPSSPAVLDLDFDGFADVVYVGDLGGQLWKWDVSPVGVDSVGDSRVDNWDAGIFFATAKESMGGGVDHHRSFFYPPSATYLHGKLVLTFGSGERHDLPYLGDASKDENNRFFVVRDDAPTGAGAFPGLGDGDLTDVTATDLDGDPSDSGYYFQVADGEKFVTDTTIFAGHVVAASFTPVPSADLCATAGGQAFLYVLRVKSGQGYFQNPSNPPSEDRRVAIGGGLPSRPRVTMAQDPDDDRIWVKTSKGKILTFDPPPRNDPGASLLYWRQRY